MLGSTFFLEDVFFWKKNPMSYLRVLYFPYCSNQFFLEDIFFKKKNLVRLWISLHWVRSLAVIILPSAIWCFCVAIPQREFIFHWFTDTAVKLYVPYKQKTVQLVFFLSLIPCCLTVGSNFPSQIKIIITPSLGILYRWQSTSDHCKVLHIFFTS